MKDQINLLKLSTLQRSTGGNFPYTEETRLNVWVEICLLQLQIGNLGMSGVTFFLNVLLSRLLGEEYEDRYFHS